MSYFKIKLCSLKSALKSSHLYPISFSLSTECLDSVLCILTDLLISSLACSILLQYCILVHITPINKIGVLLAIILFAVDNVFETCLISILLEILSQGFLISYYTIFISIASNFTLHISMVTAMNLFLLKLLIICCLLEHRHHLCTLFD